MKKNLTYTALISFILVTISGCYVEPHGHRHHHGCGHHHEGRHEGHYKGHHGRGHR